MIDPTLLAGTALAVLLAAVWLSMTVAERRRRNMRGRLTAIMTGTPQEYTASDGSIPLRRVSPAGMRSSLGLAPRWFREQLTEELGATGDRLGVTSLVLAGLVGALFATFLLSGVLQLSLVITGPILV